MVDTLSLYQNLSFNQATDLIIHINNTNWSGETTCLHLYYIQLQLELPKCILSTYPYLLLKTDYRKNFAFNILKILKDQYYFFRPSTFHKSWNIKLNGSTICEILFGNLDVKL